MIRSRTKCFLQPLTWTCSSTSSWNHIFPSFHFHHSFRQHVYTRGKAICCSRKSLCRTRLQEPYLCGVFLPQTGRHSMSKELTNQQRQIYINNCRVEWRGVAHHSEQERGQYLLEFESHPSLQDFNLRCLGLWLMIVWEQGEALSERSARLYRVLAGWGKSAGSRKSSGDLGLACIYVQKTVWPEIQEERVMLGREHTHTHTQTHLI